jgi:hypothetical protein
MKTLLIAKSKEDGPVCPYHLHPRLPISPLPTCRSACPFRVDTIKTLLIAKSKEEGPFELPPLPRLYTGLSANLMKEVPPSAIYLG